MTNLALFAFQLAEVRARDLPPGEGAGLSLVGDGTRAYVQLGP